MLELEGTLDDIYEVHPLSFKKGNREPEMSRDAERIWYLPGAWSYEKITLWFFLRIKTVDDCC